jgi:TetR/AcrR family transcriptional repressor of nem operon
MKTKHTSSNATRSASAPQARGRGRPRKAPEESEVRQRLLEAGLVALTERGYSAVSLDDILKTAAAPKGCFYHYFKSKDAYVQELLSAYDRYFQERMQRCFSEDTHSPLQRIKIFIEEGVQGMQRFDFCRGCLVGNLGQEMAALPDAMRLQLIQILQAWEARFAIVLEEAQAAGEIACSLDARSMAAFYWIGWEGAVLRAKLERSEAPLRVFIQHFFNLIEK